MIYLKSTIYSEINKLRKLQRKYIKMCLFYPTINILDLLTDTMNAHTNVYFVCSFLRVKIHWMVMTAIMSVFDKNLMSVDCIILCSCRLHLSKALSIRPSHFHGNGNIELWKRWIYVGWIFCPPLRRMKLNI